MRIATWNVERLKHSKHLTEIEAWCEKIAADILVLTETDSRIETKYRTYVMTSALKELDSAFYGEYENRVSVYSNYSCVNLHETFDKNTAICPELKTERGNLLVYGTIIGVCGNRNRSFKPDLQEIVKDIARLSGLGLPICVCGDFNLSFADNYYFTNEGREILLKCFESCNIIMPTQGVRECIDHIAVSAGFCKTDECQVTEWNKDKKLSDHKGIAVDL